jgi:hypothetical protein
MRKHLVWILAVAGAVSAVGVASAADTSGQNASFLKVKVSPTKLSKTKYKPAKLFVDTSTLNKSAPSATPTNPGLSPVPTTHVALKFDKDLKFTSTKLPQCQVSKVKNATTTQARHACAKAKVGQGSAFACVVGGAVGASCPTTPTGPNGFKQTVSAFNGKPKGGKPTIVLHSWSAGLPVPTVLVGTLNKKSNVLDVPLPPAVYNLATITDFKTTVGRKYTAKVHGKKKTFNYVTARCSDKKITLTGKFSYKSGEPADNVTAPAQKCKGS